MPLKPDDCTKNIRLFALASKLESVSKELIDALDRELPHAQKHIAAGERANLRILLATIEGD